MRLGGGGRGLTATQVAAVEETFGTMNAAVSALQEEWEMGRAEVQARLAETVGEKVRLRAEVESLKEERGRMVDELRQMRDACAAAVQGHHADKGAAWVRAVAANEALAASSQQLSVLQSENVELRAMLVSVARNLDQHRDASAAEGKERRQLQRQIQQLEDQNATEAMRFVDFDNEMDAVIAECARHKARAEAMESKCAQYDALEARCEALAKENEACRRDARRGQQEEEEDRRVQQRHLVNVSVGQLSVFKGLYQSWQIIM